MSEEMGELRCQMKVYGSIGREGVGHGDEDDDGHDAVTLDTNDTNIV